MSVAPAMYPTSNSSCVRTSITIGLLSSRNDCADFASSSSTSAAGCAISASPEMRVSGSPPQLTTTGLASTPSSARTRFLTPLNLPTAPQARLGHARRTTKAPGKPERLLESGRRDSNPRPSPWQGDALPTEPRPRCGVRIYQRRPLSGHRSVNQPAGVSAGRRSTVKVNTPSSNAQEASPTMAKSM